MDGYVQLKFTRPLSVLTSSNSFSGKSRLHMKYFKNPEKYFSFSKPDCSNISEIIIITDSASVQCWNTYLETNSPFKIFDYDTAVSMTENNGLVFQKDSIVVFDDLLLGNYKKLKSFVDSTLSVYCHHYNLTVFIINQSILNSELSQLVLKVGEFHLCVSNNSAIRVINYIARYYFGEKERKMILRAVENGQRLVSEDNYMTVRLKNNGGVPVFLNRMAHLDNPEYLCIASTDYECDRVEFKDGQYYIKETKEGHLSIRLDKLRDMAGALKKAAKITTGLENEDKYVLFPKGLYDKACEILKEEEEERLEKASENVTEENKDLYDETARHDLLSKNIFCSLDSNFPPKKRNACSRIANEILANPLIVFKNVNGRTFSVPSKKTYDINTFDFIKTISTPQIQIPGRSTKRKKIPQYQIAVSTLYENDCPRWYVLNKLYV